MNEKVYCYELVSVVKKAKSALQYNESVFKMYTHYSQALYGHCPKILNDLIRLNTESIVLNRPRVPCGSRTQSGALTSPETTNQTSSTPVKKSSTLQGKYLTFDNVEGETSHSETTSEEKQSTPEKIIPNIMESKSVPLKDISPSNADKVVSPIISKSKRKQSTPKKIIKNAKKTETFREKSLPLIHKAMDKDAPVYLISDTAVTLKTTVVSPKKTGRASDKFSNPTSQENERSGDTKDITRQPDESVGMSSIFTLKQKGNLIEYKEVRTSIVSSTDNRKNTVAERKATALDSKKSRGSVQKAAGIIQTNDSEICYFSPVKKTKMSGNPVKKPEKYVSADNEVHLVPDTRINTNSTSPNNRTNSVLLSRVPRFITSSETVEILTDVSNPVAGTVSPTNSAVSLLIYKFINPLANEEIDKDKSPKDARLSENESKPGYSRNTISSEKCATTGSPPISPNIDCHNRIQCLKDISPSERLSVNEQKSGYSRNNSPSGKCATTGSSPILLNIDSPNRIQCTRDISPSARLSVNEPKPGYSRNNSPSGKCVTTGSPPFLSNTNSPNRFQYARNISPSTKDSAFRSPPILANTNSPIRDNPIYFGKYTTFNCKEKYSPTNRSPSTMSSPIIENLDSKKHAHFLAELSCLISRREVCIRGIYKSFVEFRKNIEQISNYIESIILITQHIPNLKKDCFAEDSREIMEAFLKITSKFLKKLVSLKLDMQSDINFWTYCFDQIYIIKKANESLMSNTKPVVTIEDFLEYEESLKTKWDMLDDTITDIDSRRLHFLSTAEDFENCVILFVKFLISTGLLKPYIAI